MRRLSLAVLLLSSAALRAAAAPAAAPTKDGAGSAAAITSNQMMDLSLGEALTAVDLIELVGIFNYVSERDAPHAFASYMARDKKALKRYVGKLNGDRAAAGGLTAWDHEVCALLVNLYAGALGPVVERPKAKIIKSINLCVLSPVMTLQDIAARRKS